MFQIYCVSEFKSKKNNVYSNLRPRILLTKQIKKVAKKNEYKKKVAMENKYKSKATNLRERKKPNRREKNKKS